MNKKKIEIKRESIPQTVGFEIIRYYSVIKNQNPSMPKEDILSRIWDYYYAQKRTDILKTMPENATVEFNRIKDMRQGKVLVGDNIYKLYSDILFAMIALDGTKKEYKRIMKNFAYQLKSYGVEEDVKLREFLRSEKRKERMK